MYIVTGADGHLGYCRPYAGAGRLSGEGLILPGEEGVIGKCGLLQRDVRRSGTLLPLLKKYRRYGSDCDPYRRNYRYFREGDTPGI